MNVLNSVDGELQFVEVRNLKDSRRTVIDCPTATSVQQPNMGFRTGVAVGQESFLATKGTLLEG